MSVKIVKTIESEDGNQKLHIFQRENGTFGFEEMKFGEDEDAWFLVGRYSIAICESESTALREARDRVGWLSREKENAI